MRVPKGRKVVVKFVGRDFHYWHGDGWTPKRKRANKYSDCEAWAIRNRMNRSGDFKEKISVVDYDSRNRV